MHHLYLAESITVIYSACAMNGGGDGGVVVACCRLPCSEACILLLVSYNIGLACARHAYFLHA